MKLLPIVTRDWLKAKIETDPALIVGRALVALLKRQAAEEQVGNSTKFKNGAGFSKPDARIGCITAKYYLKHGNLLDWQLKIWVMPDKKGYPRICKYVNQLNQIANEKASRTTTLYFQRLYESNGV